MIICPFIGVWVNEKENENNVQSSERIVVVGSNYLLGACNQSFMDALQL